MIRTPSGAAPRVVHVTTTDISLALLLGPQLAAFRAAGYDVIGVSAAGPYVSQLEGLGIHHVAL
ncbi:MAG TPA: glycosyltransferase family 1 protein, partial [Acidimicrobiia bacterium]|nr:glycosyltransferase family 1 protein [Acidimicrobiia bacterium]